MNPSLDEIRGLADGILGIPDVRPQWLRDMPSAMDEGRTQFGRYYRFFFEFVKRWKPGRILEIGTYKASSIAHLAAGNPDGSCVTIDIDPEAKKIVDALTARNITALTGDSAARVKDAEVHGPFDVLFIDAFHDFANCYGEYVRYRPLVRPGGTVFFDDIHLDRQMETAWEHVVDPKAELPKLHYTGFGVCKVDPGISPRPLSDAVAEASAKFR